MHIWFGWVLLVLVQMHTVGVGSLCRYICVFPMTLVDWSLVVYQAREMLEMFMMYMFPI
jgi:hypothetical protein